MQERIVDNKGACFNCIIRCWNKSSVKSGPYRGISLVGPEYETLALMGANLGTKTVEEVAYLNERCNELGMDTISCGGVLGFAIEAKNLEWGKTEELAKLLKKIAYREGEGDILAEGVFRASKKIGSEKYAVHVKGMELPGYDPRGAFGIGLAYATSDRGACHQRAWTARPEVMDPELERFSFKKKAKLVKDIQDERAAFFSLVLCDFAPISVEDCVVLLNLATGFRYSKESYLLSGERIWNLIRVFNLREGVEEDTLPWRIFNDPFTKGPAKNKVIPHKEFKECLEEYYSLRGWNKKGVPTKEKLKQLGLVGCD
jgi:aldehyde:ferredoxin oxidoreductase